MPFQSDDQRKAAFARMGGSNRGYRPPRGGGRGGSPKPPRGGPIYVLPPSNPGQGGNYTVQPPWTPPPGQQYGNGGETIYLGGTADLDDWAQAVSTVNDIDWYDVAFEGTFFDNEDPWTLPPLPTVVPTGNFWDMPIWEQEAYIEVQINDFIQYGLP